ncbi:MAG TPA: dienelactone hydrolase family protein [Burkholderiales bacterium]|nr:dienelactone hydrolase family protein [Burkholderiales bacterium]
MNDRMREDLLALVTNKETWNRRDFMASGLATGFALAVQPVCAQTMIVTDTKGIAAGEVRIPVKGGTIPAYVAYPEKGNAFPMVLVVQEIFGVHEHIKDVCRRLAKVGYVAAAPELYYRQGDPSKLSDNKEIFAQIVSKVPDAQVMSDLDATVAWARGLGLAHKSKLAITGFCWGGRITWLYAAHNQGVKAGVAWYGRVVGDKNNMTPTNPIDVVDRINAPVLGLYGGADAGIPNDTVDKMRAALKAAGKKSDIHTYPDTPHAFHADYRPSYRKEQAEDGWKRLRAWLRKNGVA